MLRAFLKSEYLPKRYGVSEAPSTIIATNGAASEQMDITIFNELDAPRLLDLGGAQYFPVESVLGIVQVKSNLPSKGEITGALDNIASFKRLRCKGATDPIGFGALFSYSATLSWKSIVETVEEWERKNQNTTWPNLICVVDQGLLLNVNSSKSTIKNADLHRIVKPALMGVPSDGAELMTFYLLLLDLLASTELPSIPHWDYANLPMWLDGHSVRFTFGAHSQVATCRKHGPYLKDLRAGAAQEIIDGCVGNPKVSQWSLFAAENAINGPPDVFVFNPEGHAPSHVAKHIEAFRSDKDNPARVLDAGIGIESIEIDGSVYVIPYYYDVKMSLVRHCPTCPARLPVPEMGLDDWHASLREAAEERLRTFSADDGKSKQD